MKKIINRQVGTQLKIKRMKIPMYTFAFIPYGY